MLTFGDALVHLKAGRAVARSGWNGKCMWLVLIPGNDWHLHDGRNPAIGYPSLPWIGMKTADDKFVPWLASQTDILAEDWERVDPLGNEDG